MAIARAVVGRPDVVFADEPTGNLDSAAGADIVALLAGLADDGTAVVVVTHDQAVAAAMDRQVLMRDGTWSRTVGRPRLRAADLIGGGLLGLRARQLRAALSALGIAIGIAAGVAVLGISASSKANLLSQLGAEANLLTVSAGRRRRSPAPLPLTAEPMIARFRRSSR